MIKRSPRTEAQKDQDAVAQVHLDAVKEIVGELKFRGLTIEDSKVYFASTGTPEEVAEKIIAARTARRG